jgi:hypothetical protein
VTPPPSDEELFLRFVGTARAADAPASGPARAAAPPSPKAAASVAAVPSSVPSSAASSASAAPAPQARLSLRGVGVEAGARRLRAFLDEAVRAGHGSVLVEIDAGADDVVAVARSHPAVASVRDAPPRLGGKHARIIRFQHGA